MDRLNSLEFLNVNGTQILPQQEDVKSISVQTGKSNHQLNVILKPMPVMLLDQLVKATYLEIKECPNTPVTLFKVSIPLLSLMLKEL